MTTLAMEKVASRKNLLIGRELTEIEAAKLEVLCMEAIVDDGVMIQANIEKESIEKAILYFKDK